MTREALPHWIVLLDIEDFGSRPDPVRSRLREAMHSMAGSALTHAGLDPDRCPRQDRGDGLLILIPGSVSPGRLLQPFVSSLDIDLRTHLETHNASHRMRLRVGISRGLVAVEGSQWAGAVVENLAELVEAAAVSGVFARAIRARLMLVVPDDLYGSVVLQDRSRGLDPAAFGPRDYVTKQGRTLRGWVTLPGYPRPPEPFPEEAAQDTDEPRVTDLVEADHDDHDDHGTILLERPSDGVHAPSGHTPPGPEHDPDDDWPRQTPER